MSELLLDSGPGFRILVEETGVSLQIRLEPVECLLTQRGPFFLGKPVGILAFSRSCQGSPASGIVAMLCSEFRILLESVGAEANRCAIPFTVCGAICQVDGFLGVGGSFLAGEAGIEFMFQLEQPFGQVQVIEDDRLIGKQLIRLTEGRDRLH